MQLYTHVYNLISCFSQCSIHENTHFWSQGHMIVYSFTRYGRACVYDIHYDRKAISQSHMKPHGLIRVKNVSGWYCGMYYVKAYKTPVFDALMPTLII